MNAYSFIDSGLNSEDDDDDIDLPKLNFTCILNNPLEDTNDIILIQSIINELS